LTQGLLDLLEPRELEAVIAHELAHVVNRDAAVMTVVGAPGEALLAGGVRVASQGWFPIVVGGVIASGIGWVGTYGTRHLSRYREYAADAGAVALTGSPAALAAALMKVSDGLVAMPKRDLREASLHDAFHLLPVSREQPFGLPDTHPPLRARIERLQRLERSLQRF
jgi:heat shock protein HtpX